MKIEGDNPIARYLRCWLDGEEVTWSTLCANTETGEVELLVRDENGKIKKGADGWPMYETRKGKVEIRIDDKAPATARMLWLAEIELQKRRTLNPCQPNTNAP